MTREEKMRFLVMRSVGNFLLLVSLYGVVMTFGPVLYLEVQYRTLTAEGIHFTVADTTTQVQPGNTQPETPQAPPAGYGFGALLAKKREQVMVPVNTDFGIVIPKIGANSKVIPNVDPDNPDEFLPLLMQGVAHAKGSVFPGLPGTTYLFAHSTDNWWNVGRYNAVFYLLKELQPGDDVVVFFENRRHNYVVKNTVITDPSDVTRLVHSQEGTDEKLILQTCWPPGTTWKRLFVEAVPKRA